MRVLAVLCCLLVTAQSYLLTPFPYPGLSLVPAIRYQSYQVPRLQTPDPPEFEPVVISLDEFDCDSVGVFPDEESGCEKYWVCNEKKVRG